MNIDMLSDNVRKLSALVNTHIGANGDAHLVGSVDQNGFMSKEDKLQIDRNGMYAHGKDATIQQDILKLDYGFYAGANWLNKPKDVDDAIALIEVKGNGGLFKEIVYHWLSAGRTYTRYIYGTIDSGWDNPDWISIVPINGFTGDIKARRVKASTTYIIEVRFSLACNFSSHAITQIATLPSFYKSLTGISPYGVIPAQIGSKNITVNWTINQSNRLNIFRNDDSNDPITHIFGSLLFTE